MANSHRMIVIVPSAALTTENQEAIATTIANAVGSTMEDEMGMFDPLNYPHYSYPETPTVFAAMIFDIAGTPALYDDLKTTLTTLNEELLGLDQIRWYGIASLPFDSFDADDLIESNQSSVNGEIGNYFSLTEVLADSNLQEREF